MVSFMLLSASHDASAKNNSMMWVKKSCSTNFDCLDLRNEICNWQCHLASGDTVMLTLAPFASHDQEQHVAPHFSCIDLRNAKVLLMMLLALCDAGANDVTWQKRHVAYHFIWLPEENNVSIYDAAGIIWHWSQWHHVTPTPMAIIWCQWQLCNETKKSCYSSFWLCWPKESNGDIENADSIIWCQHQYQWHAMTRKVMLHLTLIFWTQGT